MRELVETRARAAREAARSLALANARVKSDALLAMARGLEEKAPAVLEANRADLERARGQGHPRAFLDRLTLTDARIEDMAAGIRQVAALPDPAQGQYVQELLDYFDRDAAGEHDAGKYGWITGHPDPRSLNEQRERTPDLYRAMHIERKAWWTGRIEGFLEAGRTVFILIGMNHTLGPDSIQANLARRGLTVESV